jgi:predicted nucleic-acid-binding Zn-ribbon protein
MQVHNLIAGEWYHTVDCSKCGSAIHAFHARSGPEERLPGPGLYQVRCGQCGYPDLYKPATFVPRKMGAETEAAEPPAAAGRFRKRSGIDRRQKPARQSLAAARAQAGGAYSH